VGESSADFEACAKIWLCSGEGRARRRSFATVVVVIEVGLGDAEAPDDDEAGDELDELEKVSPLLARGRGAMGTAISPALL
jgi:hypothetical protein